MQTIATAQKSERSKGVNAKNDNTGSRMTALRTQREVAFSAALRRIACCPASQSCSPSPIRPLIFKRVMPVIAM